MQCREEERVQAALICRERYLFMSKRLGCEVSAYCSTYTVKQYILAYIGFDVRLVLECKKGALKAHQQLHATLGEKASCEAQFQHSKQELKTEDDRLADLHSAALCCALCNCCNEAITLKRASKRCDYDVNKRCRSLKLLRSVLLLQEVYTAICHRAHVERALTALCSRSMSTPYVL
eukprot:2932-Heterococcus_DN1.PRE.1